MHRGRLIRAQTFNLTQRRSTSFNSQGQTSKQGRPLRSILIANRGEIACRVSRTAEKQGIKIATVYTDPDRESQHALSSTNATNLGHSSAYLDGDRIIAAAKNAGCEAIHPGYGFLSENSAFARKCGESGLVFIGPTAAAIEAMGNKSRSKELVIAANVPCIPGYHGANQDPKHLMAEAQKIGFPVMLKAVNGGGGKGMRIARTPGVFYHQLDSAKSEARVSFGDDNMLVEKYISAPRHIEVQVFADQHGNCVALGERDCSVQRRHQKLLEESPAPNLDQAVRRDLWDKARAAALAVGYTGAGTVEFLVDKDTGSFFFMEMNTRLQVEHPVSEMVTGLDLVQWQIIVAEGGLLPCSQEEIEARMSSRGHAIEARICAENTNMNFMPDSGRINHMTLPKISDDVRVDAGYVVGDLVSAHYDSMIAKLIVRGPNREAAIQKLSHALDQYQIAGVATNVGFLQRVCSNDAFVAGDVDTAFIENHTELLEDKERFDPEVYLQAALALLISEQVEAGPFSDALLPGFGKASGARSVELNSPTTDESMFVHIQAVGLGVFDMRIGERTYKSVACGWNSEKRLLRTFLPTKRLESVIIRDQHKLTIFQHGQEYHLQLAATPWLQKAMGRKEVKNSVLAPMPCKILRVDVHVGQQVVQDQALLVIESMKMETTIRSPQAGRIARIVHEKGEVCPAGTALIEFEDST